MTDYSPWTSAAATIEGNYALRIKDSGLIFPAYFRLEVGQEPHPLTERLDRPGLIPAGSRVKLENFPAWMIDKLPEELEEIEPGPTRAEDAELLKMAEAESAPDADAVEFEFTEPDDEWLDDPIN